MSIQDGSVGQLDFVTRHGLHSPEQRAAIERIEEDIARHRLRTIRVAWGDQHGVVRGKHVMVHDFMLALRNGIDFQTATLFMDTTNNMFAPMFSSDAGLGMRSLAGGPDMGRAHRLDPQRDAPPER
jgi:glutamine synthetase